MAVLRTLFPLGGFPHNDVHRQRTVPVESLKNITLKLDVCVKPLIIWTPLDELT